MSAESNGGTAMAVSSRLSPEAGGMTVSQRGGIQLRSLQEIVEFARLALATQFVPPSMKTVQSVVISIQYGLELGMSPMQAIQSIAVINNRPSVWGDAALAIVRRSPLCEWVKEWSEGSGDKLVCYCESKRKGTPDPSRTEFSWDDAKVAGLATKQTYKQYPKRMCQLRARSFNLRDNFADLLCGLVLSEEAADYTHAPASGGAIEFAPANPDAKVGRSAINDQLDGNETEESTSAEEFVEGEYGFMGPPSEEEQRKEGLVE